ncbi:hypothetical protein A2715_04820 [Candidatus Woesebacteria bacterium RIFCSPHIGHO2_01_FULL_39_32]|uniref:CMP/dCMP-type deaminase domain-containing protein n=1 Tax=Candidatus Woesebacteria bacterium RIFCSPLOWO2_01_FULL_39_25 TaxID=1802521 RepID=A0A1F8BLH2_9BACT|nr:MAG: hypothetical protein A2715_04820 [Candidatus Woesebacteria bacterium RIFCSPHIGHO2_01_FULL_39_32]OGM37840.1 MAG: hypothetical protein A3F01_02030 [Candidatus Woesebacteria bacterium RIFCSPHIGHO2_12_FULL_38_11]OGM64872.1 MAG: hypothetical protein A2893_04430 [Candidatus Woesebacteria bacterium RIFCSPLOWO2_01_FULL_39_25]
MVKIQGLHENFMRAALKEAIFSKRKGEWVGGAVLIRGGKIIAKAQNTVQLSKDPTAHSEINVIRKACRKLNTTDLEGTDLYTNAEPCPMCMSACIWSNIRNVYYGASLKDLMKLGDFQIKIFNSDIVKKSFRKVGIKGGILREESLKLL